MKKRNIFQNIFKTVLIYGLLLCLLCTSYMPVSATEPLGAGDTFIYVDMYSVEAEDKYSGDFF